MEDSVFKKHHGKYHLILQKGGNCKHYCPSSPDQMITKLITLPPITIPLILNYTILESRYQIKVSSLSKADLYVRDINNCDYENSHSATL